MGKVFGQQRAGAEVLQQELARIGVPISRQTMANEILHADETTLMVLYDYQPSRAGECASRCLEGFTGLLHTDGYGAYHCKLPPEITVVGCWTHIRRKFTDTLKGLPNELLDRSPAKIGLDYCDKPFRVESDYTEGKLSFQERYQARLEQSKPLAKKFFDWAKAEYEKNPVPKSMLGAR